jgi:hypothetical protein
MAPTWLTAVAWTALAVAVASAAVIVVDVYGRGYRQRHMPVMEAVWPITALYLGPLAVWGYRRYGRPASPRWLTERGADHPRTSPAGPASPSTPATAAPAAPSATWSPSSSSSG